jgi:prophage regulatory protein
MLSSGSTPRRLIRRDELKRRVPYSLTHIWRLEQRDEFPKRIPIGPGRVAWDADEVTAWLENRIRTAGKIAPPSRRKPG